MPWLVPPVVVLALALVMLAVRVRRREAAALGVAEEGVRRLRRSARRLERRLDFALRSTGEEAEAVDPRGDGAALAPAPPAGPPPEPHPPAPS